MAKERIDADTIQDLIASGSVGKGFRDLGSENTGSLGLKITAVELSASMSDILDEDDVSSPFHIPLQYLTAKVFETRDNTSLTTFSGSQAYVISRTNKSNILGHQNSIDSISIVTASYAACLLYTSDAADE